MAVLSETIGKDHPRIAWGRQPESWHPTVSTQSLHIWSEFVPGLAKIREESRGTAAQGAMGLSLLRPEKTSSSLRSQLGDAKGDSRAPGTVSTHSFLVIGSTSIEV
jgi:hypothetical protein